MLIDQSALYMAAALALTTHLMAERTTSIYPAYVSAVVTPMIPLIATPSQLYAFWEQAVSACQGIECPTMKAYCMSSCMIKLRLNLMSRPRMEKWNEDRMFEAYLIHEEILKAEFSDCDSANRELKRWYIYHRWDYTKMDELD